MCIRVDLPEPDGPMIAVRLPLLELEADAAQRIDGGRVLAVAAGHVGGDDHVPRRRVIGSFTGTHRSRDSRARSASLRRMALADQFDGLLVDLDGVVWIGRELVPGAVEALATLLDGGKEIVFVTNNSVQAASRLRGAAARGRGPAADDRVVTAGAATARLAAERVGPGGTAFVIGAPGFKETVAAAGLELLDGEAAHARRRGRRLRPPRVRLRRAA